jgi:predicted nuclease of restriction endonuclease-like (RecB) superfamily
MKLEENTYKDFVSNIKQRIHSAQYEAMKAVNKQQIQLNWDIGQMIVEKQEQHGWGKSIVEQLSKDLQTEFPGQRGWSARNLWLMKQLYETYRHNEFLQPMVAEIGWTHNVRIMSKCKDDLERKFYIRMTRKYGWTKDVLTNQIEGNSYSLYLTNQTNFEQTLPKKYKKQAILAVKNEYNFDFLGLADKHSERDLEQALVNNIRHFLIEMGGDFTFVGNQFRMEIDEKEYFIDLLLYHRQLQSLVAIELKIGEFIPEYAGKMQFYLTALNKTIKHKHEKPSIGIIICKTKTRTTVEYALSDAKQPIGVASYTLHSKLPDIWKKLLPSAERIAENLKFIEN